MSPPDDKPRSYSPARLTPKQFQDLGNFFKGFLADNPLITASIIAAGIGGALEGLHILWLMARFLLRR
jgi:hypothetical protein